MVEEERDVVVGLRKLGVSVGGGEVRGVEDGKVLLVLKVRG